jgi:hypothetical protein
MAVFLYPKKATLGEKQGLWLGQKAHIQEIVDLNPAVYYMDVSAASYYVFFVKGNKGS